VGVPPPHHNVLADGTIDDVVYAPDPAYDGRYGYVARTQGGAAAALLFLGDMLGITTLYEAMTGRNLSTGKWMTADEQQQSQVMAGITLATWAIPVARVGGMAARAETGMVNIGVRAAGTEARFALSAAAKSTVPATLYHYTSEAGAAGIMERGLLPGASGKVFTTTAGDLSPLQAQIELALSPNRGLPGAMLEIDAAGLEQAGIKPLLGPLRVQPTINAPGGGTEVIFNQQIPSQFIKRVR
jgi:hypothetical protein